MKHGKRIKYTFAEGTTSMAIPMYKAVNRSQRRALAKERVLIENVLLRVEFRFTKLLFEDNGYSYKQLFEFYAKLYLRFCNFFLRNNKLKYHKIDLGYFIKSFEGNN